MFTIAIHPPLFCVAFLVVFIITFLVRIIKRGHRIRLCYIGIIELYIMLLKYLFIVRQDLIVV